MKDLTFLDTITLKSGAHSPGGNEMCAMEAAAYVAGEPWSDHPQCVCPVIASFLRSWNDGLPDDDTRTRILVPLVKLVIGSRSTQEVESARAWVVLDWLVRTATPMSLDLTVSLRPHAAKLRELPEITANSIASCREDISAAGYAAWTAAGSAAGTAAGSAAGSAAWTAARDAAGYAAGTAAWGAAWDAARTAAGDALSDVVTKSQESAADLIRRLIEVR